MIKKNQKNQLNEIAFIPLIAAAFAPKVALGATVTAGAMFGAAYNACSTISFMAFSSDILSSLITGQDTETGLFKPIHSLAQVPIDVIAAGLNMGQSLLPNAIPKGGDMTKIENAIFGDPSLYPLLDPKALLTTFNETVDNTKTVIDNTPPEKTGVPQNNAAVKKGESWIGGVIESASTKVREFFTKTETINGVTKSGLDMGKVTACALLCALVCLAIYKIVKWISKDNKKEKNVQELNQNYKQFLNKLQETNEWMNTFGTNLTEGNSKSYLQQTISKGMTVVQPIAKFGVESQKKDNNISFIKRIIYYLLGAISILAATGLFLNYGHLIGFGANMIKQQMTPPTNEKPQTPTNETPIVQ